MAGAVVTLLFAVAGQAVTAIDVCNASPGEGADLSCTHTDGSTFQSAVGALGGRVGRCAAVFRALDPSVTNVGVRIDTWRSAGLTQTRVAGFYAGAEQAVVAVCVRRALNTLLVAAHAFFAIGQRADRAWRWRRDAHTSPGRTFFTPNPTIARLGIGIDARNDTGFTFVVETSLEAIACKAVGAIAVVNAGSGGQTQFGQAETLLPIGQRAGRTVTGRDLLDTLPDRLLGTTNPSITDVVVGIDAGIGAGSADIVVTDLGTIASEAVRAIAVGYALHLRNALQVLANTGFVARLSAHCAIGWNILGDTVLNGFVANDHPVAEVERVHAGQIPRNTCAFLTSLVAVAPQVIGAVAVLLTLRRGSARGRVASRHGELSVQGPGG